MNTNLLEQPQPRTVITSRPPVIAQTDLTRGAVQHGLRNQKVLLATEVLDDYSEIDRSLGNNAAGQILAVLARHIQLMPGGGREDTLTVCLHRREDGRDVEVYLTLSRSRRQGQEYLQLFKAGDREID